MSFSRSDLLALNAGLDEQTRTHNALLTAGDAIAVIGGLVENIHGALQSAGTSDPAAEQARIDNAITTIDAIATSSRFGGKPLLTGTFSATGAAGTLAVPSFVSTSLGAIGVGANATATLSSLASGSELDLSHGNTTDAARVVTAALGQVQQTQSQIAGFVSSNSGADAFTLTAPVTTGNEDAAPVESLYHVGSMMLDHPALAALATANSSPAAVLPLLQP